MFNSETITKPIEMDPAGFINIFAHPYSHRLKEGIRKENLGDKF